MKLNPFVKAGIGLTFALIWSCPTLAAITETKNFGLDVKITGQSEDDRDLGTQPGGRYVAQIEIPAATYTETPIEPQEGADESGDTNRQTVERTKNPLDMAEVKLILWSIE